MACACPSSSSSSAVSGASCGPRISSVNCTSPGITFTAPGAQRRVPTVATVTAALAGQVFHLHHPFRRRGEGVLAMKHRHRAGMASFAGKTAVQPSGAVNRLHHAERQPRLLRARPLLDMQFRVGGDIPRVTGRVGDPRRIESGIHQRPGDAHPVGIAL